MSDAALGQEVRLDSCTVATVFWNGTRGSISLSSYEGHSQLHDVATYRETPYESDTMTALRERARAIKRLDHRTSKPLTYQGSTSGRILGMLDDGSCYTCEQLAILLSCPIKHVNNVARRLLARGLIRRTFASRSSVRTAGMARVAFIKAPQLRLVTPNRRLA